MPNKPRVLVVGGQFAGKRVKLLLERSGFDVLLVDSKNFFEFTPSVLRALVEPGHIDKILIRHKTVVHGVVKTVRPAAASELQDPDNPAGRPLEVLIGEQWATFDYVVLASGSGYAAPIKPPLPSRQATCNGPCSSATSSRQGSGSSPSSPFAHQAAPASSSAGSNPPCSATHPQPLYTMSARKADLKAAAAEVAAASSILVVGGGSVGVELAAEIVGKFGYSKRVMLMSSQGRLLDRMPQKARRYAEQWLRDKGVQVVLGERLVQWPQAGHIRGKHSVTTASGQHLDADLVFNCTGYTELASDMCQALQAQAMGSGANGTMSSNPGRKGLPVLDTLQVKGQDYVFACGDLADLPHEKTAYTADLTANLAADNIIRLQQGRQLLHYPKDVSFLKGSGPPTVTVISLYKYDGIMQYNGLVITGPLAALSKAFVERVQLAVARGSWLATQLWLPLEGLITMLGRLLFTRYQV